MDVVKSSKVVLRPWQCTQDKHFDNFLGFITLENGDEHWTFLPENKSKVNIDVAIFESSNCYNFAYVLRNIGALTEARSKCMSWNISPESAEVTGLEKP